MYFNGNIDPRDVSDVKINHGSLKSDWTSALFRRQKKKCVLMFYCFSFTAYIRFFDKVLTEKNANIRNEFIFSAEHVLVLIINLSIQFQ